MLPTKLYWVLFPIDDLRQAIETAKRILTKEKIDRQLAGKPSSTPFMSIEHNYNKKVTFDTWDGLEDKIDRLTVMMGKLTTRDNGTNKQFKPQIYQSKRRGQNRNVYDTCNYDRGNYQNRSSSNSWDRRVQFNGQVEVEQGMNRIIGMIIGEEILEVMWEHIEILKDRIEEDIEEILGMRITTEKEVGVGLEIIFREH